MRNQVFKHLTNMILSFRVIMGPQKGTPTSQTKTIWQNDLRGWGVPPYRKKSAKQFLTVEGSFLENERKRFFRSVAGRCNQTHQTCIELSDFDWSSPATIASIDKRYNCIPVENMNLLKYNLDDLHQQYHVTWWSEIIMGWFEDIQCNFEMKIYSIVDVCCFPVVAIY